jgi:hypothetical protein
MNRLTERDLSRIVRRVLKESGYRTKFENHEYWIDEKGNYIKFDPDLENAGYYDFDYEPYSEVENFEDIPEDIKKRLFGDEKYGRTFYDAYKNRHGNFKYSRRKY